MQLFPGINRLLIYLGYVVRKAFSILTNQLCLAPTIQLGNTDKDIELLLQNSEQLKKQNLRK